LLFDLLIAVLQLLHITGEIADRRLEAIDPRQEVGGRVLGAGGVGAKSTGERGHKQAGGTDHRRRLFR
jgi:hypothetical protein